MNADADADADAETRADPEIGRTILAGAIRTNVHDVGRGRPLLMIHGSGPGVSAWANWRLNMGPLAQGLADRMPRASRRVARMRADRMFFCRQYRRKRCGNAAVPGDGKRAA